ncbi:MAG: four helix bundle protein [Halomonas sp.]
MRPCVMGVRPAGRVHTCLRDLDVEVAVLKHRVRKAQRMRYITPSRYLVWAEHIDELGRMIGGWIKHETAKAS